MIHVTLHAIQRYQERVAEVDEAQAREALSSKTMQIAASFGSCTVRLATGQRAVIKEGCVVTVKPAPRRLKTYKGKPDADTRNQ